MGEMIGYARVSTKDQDLAIQTKQLTEAGCKRIFSEKRSGTKLEGRDELERAISYLRPGDIFVVTKIDRMARSVPDFYKSFGRIREAGAEFKCLNQPLMDTTIPSGRMMMNFLVTFAEFENDMRQERQREGIEAARAAGKYQQNRRRRLYSNKRYAKAKRLLDEGKSYYEAGQITGISRKQLMREYPGYDLKYEWEHVDGKIKRVQPDKPSTPSAAEAVEADTSAKPQASKRRVLGGLFGRG